MTIETPVLTLASINIERSKHIPRVSSFLRAHSPDVLCLQELVPEDLGMFRDVFGYEHQFYFPMCRYPEHEQLRPTGLGIVSRLPFTSTEHIVYAGHGSGLDVVDRTSEETKFRTSRYAVALAEIALGGVAFTIATTHFPWTDGARTSDFQRTSCDALLRLLGGRLLILCGDFNAPRGKEIFHRLAQQWTDHIPPAYATSLDPVLHRAGPLQLMVDGLFSTDDYCVSGVTLHQGISDHCAVTACVRKRALPAT